MSACPPFSRLIFVCLLLYSYFLIHSPVSLAVLGNHYPWPSTYQGLDVEKENITLSYSVPGCSREKGRSFNVTHAQSFRLAGLSVYIYVPNNNESRFSRDFFRLTFKQPGHDSLASGVLPTYSGKIDIVSGQPTFEVYFPLDVDISGGIAYTALLECLTDEEALLRVAESRNPADGLINGYYNSVTSQTSAYYAEGYKALFTSFIVRGAPHFPPPPPVPDPPPVVTVPQFHPVIFIHGLGGDPSNFESDAQNRNYVKLLTDLGYPREYIHLYSYGYKDDGKGHIIYNYQGDVREIAQGMEVVVNSLSDLHKGQGGDGQVDIVAHSLGNLVTRQYLVTHKDNHKIRRYIAVGAPFKGAWPLAVDSGIRGLPVVGRFAEKELANFVMDVINANRERKLNKSSVVYDQLVPSSNFLSDLNSTTISGLEVYALYGDVNATLRQRIFNRTFEKKFDFGDGLILANSASYTDWASSSKKLAFSGKIVLDIKYQKSNSAIAGEVKISDLSSVRSLHSDLLTNDSYKGKIKCILSEADTEGCL